MRMSNPSSRTDAMAILQRAVFSSITAGLRRFGGLAAVAAHEVAAHLTGGLWLAPAVPAVGFNTSLDGAGVIAPS